MEKYRMLPEEAEGLADFLTPMLHWDQEARSTAEEMLNHPWLKMEKKENTQISEAEHNKQMLKKKFEEIDGEDKPDLSTLAFDDAEADIEDFDKD